MTKFWALWDNFGKYLFITLLLITVSTTTAYIFALGVKIIVKWLKFNLGI